MADWHPLIVANAPNGTSRTKAHCATLPITPAELAITAAEIVDAGAAMFHIHVPDNDGRHLLDETAYRDATGAIRRAVGNRLVIQITSEADGYYYPPGQMVVIPMLAVRCR